MATEQTDTQRTRHSAQGVTEGTARFDSANSANSNDIRIGKVIDLSLAGKGNFVARRGVLTELVWLFLEAAVITDCLRRRDRRCL